MKMMQKIAIMAFALAPLCGCQHTFYETALPDAEQRPEMEAAAAAYVAMPFEGFPGSGFKTTQAIQTAFAQRLRQVVAATGPEQKNAALDTARQKGCKYLVFPAIIQWDDNLTEYSGQSDTVQLRMDLLDVATGTLIHSTLLTGKSPFTTLGHLPEHMLSPMLSPYVARFVYR